MRAQPSGLGLINCIDATAFAQPAQFTFGNAPRNMLRGPGFSRTDIALSKNFNVAGRTRLMVQAQVFNVFNEVNWGAPNTTFGAANSDESRRHPRCARWSSGCE